MGQLRFLVPRPDRLDDEALRRSYLTGMDTIPWPSKVGWANGELVAERDIRESGNFYLPWHVSGHGQVMLNTACLMERRAPYLLPLELARGTVNRCRNQAANWQLAGLALSNAYNEKIRDASNLFAHAATNQAQPDVAADSAEQAIRFGLDAMDLLIRDYVEQVIAIRQQQTPKFSTLLGTKLGPVPVPVNVLASFLEAFNSVEVPFPWSQLELEPEKFDWAACDQQFHFCREHGLKVVGGPLLRLDATSLPHWMYLWLGDFEAIQQHVVQFTKAVVQRYRGRVHLWHATAGLNLPDSLRLTEEQRLRLTVDVIDTIRQLDPRIPVILSVEQPWGEYLAHDEMELSPFHFADTLARSDLGIAGLGLEINHGYWPGGTLPRDFVEWTRLLDQWSMLGLPLLVFLTAPSDVRTDEAASRAARPVSQLRGGPPSPQVQSLFAEQLLPFLVAVQAVQGVFWNQWSDAGPHELPHAGVFDETLAAKPTLQPFQKLRRSHVM